MALIPLLIFSALMLACGACSGPGASTSRPLITNGEKISDKIEPFVVLLHNSTDICTGTFVGPATLITAAHCVKDGIVNFEEIAPAHKTLHPAYDKNDPETHSDIAVLVYPQDCAPATARFSTRLPLVKDDVLLVGYGVNSYPSGQNDGVGSMTRRQGRNKINKFDDGMIEVIGTRYDRPGKPGENSASGAGDSGSPLIGPGGVIGIVTTGMLEDDAKHTYAVPILRTDVLDFFRMAVRKGAVIPDLMPMAGDSD
jgi:Trypsin